MNYKNLQDFEHITDMRDNQSGHFTQKCPFCGIVQMQIDARNNRGRCHNYKCKEYHKWYTIDEIYHAIQRSL